MSGGSAVGASVGEEDAAGVMQALDAFSAAEVERWEKVRRSEPLPIHPVDVMERRGADAAEHYWEGEEREGMDPAGEAWVAACELNDEGFGTVAEFDRLYVTCFNEGEWFRGWTCRLQELADVGDPGAAVVLRRMTEQFGELFPDEPCANWFGLSHQSAGRGSGTPGRRPGRNAPCWCGSASKYKHRCLRRNQAA